MKKILTYIIIILVFLVLGAGIYLFRPPSHTPDPVDFACIPVTEDTGKFMPLTLDEDNMYGVALTYASIIDQTGSEYDPDIFPPVFRKLKSAINPGNTVQYPDQQSIWDVVREIEPHQYNKLESELKSFPVLMDYEAELGIVLLEDVTKEQLSDKTFSPPVGYFLANDLQSISMAVLGMGTEFESNYFDAKGSFPGFLPLSSRMWIPYEEKADSSICIELKTQVNGKLRQHENTKNRIYSNREILLFILRKYNKEKLTKGTAVITGSPAGVANETPRWKRRLARLLGINRIRKLQSIPYNRFLKPGDVVIVEGGPLGRIATKIIVR